MQRWMTILLMMCGAAQAAWVPMATEGGRSFFADPATIRKDGATTQMTTLVEHSRFQRMVEVGYFSQKFVVQYDCKGNRARRLAQTFHAGHMGEGAVIYSDEAEQEWEAVTADSTGEKLLRLACPN